LQKGWPGLFLRVEAVDTFGVLGIPVEILITGDTPDVGSDAIVCFQDVPGFEALVEDGAAAQQMCYTFGFFER
jgi:hypothetical protein